MSLPRVPAVSLAYLVLPSRGKGRLQHQLKLFLQMLTLPFDFFRIIKFLLTVSFVVAIFSAELDAGLPPCVATGVAPGQGGSSGNAANHDHGDPT